MLLETELFVSQNMGMIIVYLCLKYGGFITVLYTNFHSIKSKCDKTTIFQT